MTLVETKPEIIRLAEKCFGFKTLKLEDRSKTMSGIKRPLRVALRLSETHVVDNGGGRETVRHFFSLVPTGFGGLVRFNDVGSKAVKFEPEWRITNRKKRT